MSKQINLSDDLIKAILRHEQMDQVRILNELRAEVAKNLQQAPSEESESTAQRAKKTKELGSTFRDQRDFEEGDLVVWKDGHKNRRFPEKGMPGMVIKIYDNATEVPFASEEDAGSPLFREPLDLALGFLDSDGDFAVYHFDSRRFKKYSEQ